MTETTTAPAIPGYKSGTWELDATHSELGFSVRHMMVAKVRGRFTEFSGTLTTGENPADSNVSVTVQLGSIQTGNEQRDGHLRSPDFFGTDENAEMTFVSREFTGSGNDWTVTGDLTLKGITKPLTLEVEVVGLASDAYGGYRSGFSAKGSLNRQDYGVTWNQAIEGGGVVVSDKVVLEIEAEFVLQA